WGRLSAQRGHPGEPHRPQRRQGVRYARQVLVLNSQGTEGSMNARSVQGILAGALLLACRATGAEPVWQEEFGISKCNLLTTGRNPYFVLEPGHQLVLEGGGTKLQITVLDETKTVDGVVTRVVEEKEWKDGKLHEIARNYFAICEQTKDVFYFG